MKILLKRSPLSIVGGVLATLITPPPIMTPSALAAEIMIVADGPRAGELWDPEQTPYIVEPLDSMISGSGVNEIAIRKSAQTGFTTMLLAAAAYIIDRDPCRAMIVQPTSGALADFNKDKLTPTLEQSPVLAAKIKSQTSRSGDASTVTSKRFQGGSITLAIANSAADLRSKTVKVALCDEIDEYPDDLDGQGDPMAMIEARQESFLMSGEWLRVYVSTPTIKAASRIDAQWERSDKRYWHMPCPGCGEMFRFEFDRKHFRFKADWPHEAHYATPCCGTVIEDADKVTVMKRGRWIATEPRPGAIRGYHFDALASPFVPFDKIASRFIGAEGDPMKMKAFYNLTLGLAYEMKGDAPDHVRLMERRDKGLQRGRIPARGLVLTGAADVQMNGIWYEIIAWASNRENWTVDAGYIAGATDDPHGGAFVRLEEIRQQQWPDAFGGARTVDSFGVDSGYRSHVVYTWVRGKAATFALDGRDGWSKPAIGAPSPVDINFNGQRIRRGAMVWGVGTWPLKGVIYADLRKEGVAAGKEVDPAGYCHFGDWIDEVYFRQITSEYLTNENYRGRVRRVWKVRNGEENHLFDCRVYNYALADYLGVSRMTADQWAVLASRRGVPQEIANPDMFAPEPVRVASAAPVVTKPSPMEAAPRPMPQEDEDTWISNATGWWDD